MACVALKFYWRVSPLSFHGVCRLKFSRRVSPSGFHGVCRLQVSFHGVCRLQVCFIGVCRLLRLLACVAFQVCFLDGRHLHLCFCGVCDLVTSMKFLLSWPMCCVISLRDVYRADFYSASCCMVCFSLNYVPLNLREPAVVAGLAIGILFFRNVG